jgi:hypothetical protein
MRVVTTALWPLVKEWVADHFCKLDVLAHTKSTSVLH